MTKLTVEVDTNYTNYKWEYPFLGVDKYGHIALFTESGKGIFIYEGDNSGVKGTYLDRWDMSLFKPFTGSITLTQT